MGFPELVYIVIGDMHRKRYAYQDKRGAYHRFRYEYHIDTIIYYYNQ
jgi:hypothetical protein